MRQVPLFLKIKGSSEDPHFRLCSESAITLNDMKYEFNSIFHDSLSADALQSLTKLSATILLVGTKDSGKSASLMEILRSFSRLNANVQVSACELGPRNTFVDLIDGEATKNFVSSALLGSQLKKVTLEGRVITKLMKQRMATDAKSNTQTKRPCLLLQIYHNSKVLSIYELSDSRLFKASSKNTSALSSNSSSPHFTSSRIRSSASKELPLSTMLFRASNLSIIMHLNHNGDVSSDAQFLEGFSHFMETLRSGENGTSRPKASSAVIPHYAKPTMSSASPNTSNRIFKVNKPIKRRFENIEASGPKMSPLQRQRLNNRSKSRSLTSPSTVDKSEKLQNDNVALQSQLTSNRLQYTDSIQALRLQLCHVKEQGLSVIQKDLTKARSRLEIAAGQSKESEELARIAETKLTKLEAENHSVNTKLMETSQQLAEKIEAFDKTNNAHDKKFRDLAAKHESEIESLEKKIVLNAQHAADLGDSQKKLEAEVIRLQAENERLSEELESSLAKSASMSDDKTRFEKQLSEMRNSAASDKTSLEMLKVQLEAKHQEIKRLQDKIHEESTLQAEKSLAYENQAKNIEFYMQDIEKLKVSLASQAELQEEAKIALHNSEKEASSYKTQLEEMNKVLNEASEKIRISNEAQEAQENEISHLRNTIQSHEEKANESHLLSNECDRLRNVVADLSEKIRQKDVEHERHVIRLNEELGKARTTAATPKRISQVPDLDFHNGNNTFSSIDIFDDQTEYMNFFRRPVLGKSPAASPTRALTESNVRSSPQLKEVGKVQAVCLDLVPVNLNDQENFGNTIEAGNSNSRH